MNEASQKTRPTRRRRRSTKSGATAAAEAAATPTADVTFFETEAFSPATTTIVETVVPAAPPVSMSQEDQKLALFIDIDNVIIGLRESGHPKFDVKLLLSRLLDKGKIVIKKAYADWSRYAEYKRAFHESAFELIDIPQHKMTGKNSADIRMVVDAMDLASNKEHITTFVIGSGDSDFSPLVSKLKENNKTVLGFGVKGSTSELLIENCDEFIYYEDLVREQVKVPAVAGLPEKSREVFSLLIESMQALQRENKEILWGSMVKQTMQRKNPSFSESYYGFRAFSDLLESAQKHRVITLRRDAKSGSYVITGYGPGTAR
ncbi:MAG: NYN domain-containing protein [Thermoanaerobaculia bacterium]|nr:NYN domain-containing protein [Thermoanaerobaculia bacterium]